VGWGVGGGGESKRLSCHRRLEVSAVQAVVSVFCWCVCCAVAGHQLSRGRAAASYRAVRGMGGVATRIQW
jgi:DNA-binding transcriptional regulator of glucitol operon